MLWIGLLIGMVIGFVTRALIARRRAVGTICVYENKDGGEPYMFLVLEQDINSVLETSTAALKIKVFDAHE